MLDVCCGQDYAKKVMSVAVYNHYKREVVTNTMDEIEIDKIEYADDQTQQEVVKHIWSRRTQETSLQKKVPPSDPQMLHP